MTEAQKRASDNKRIKHKEYADQVGLSEYKVAKYGKKFLEDNPLVLESLVLVHRMTGYYNVPDDVKAVRKEMRDQKAASKKYYEKNKETVNARHKVYVEKNKETINARHKVWVKKYYEDNREKILARAKKYGEDNREIINEKQRQKRLQTKNQKQQ